MASIKTWAAVVASWALAGAAAAQPAPTPVQAQVESGTLAGAVSGGLARFKAIPYAAPPVGPLRWRAPQPPLAWDGVRPALDYGPACVQTSGASLYHGPQSEDCLTLNVVAPADLRGARRPVMVWIHGGGFIGGAGSQIRRPASPRTGWCW